jgi:hypothetical protein
MEGEPSSYLTIYQYDDASPEGKTGELIRKFHIESEEWKQREFIVGPPGGENVDLAWDETTRFVKIGMILCHQETGRADVDFIDISPIP